MKDKTSWFIKLWNDNDPTIFGIGECGPLPGLSMDDRPDYEDVLSKIVTTFNIYAFASPASVSIDFISLDFPSIRFGFETALLDLRNGGQRIIYNNDFIRNKPIPINGLIWMGDLDFMMRQINKKIGEGFSCIKLKVGGLDFDRECDIISYIRQRYYNEDVTIRLDANGAFNINDVLFRLDQLAKYNIHSIEQPIKPGLDEMEELCRKSPIPVAFDEELIGKESAASKRQLLERLKPPFIVLKPTLHGGLQGCEDWISMAEELNIGWWITSALETNIGLNAICQFTANYPTTIPQGLGTGAIYDNNIQSPLTVNQGNIYLDNTVAWQIGDMMA